MSKNFREEDFLLLGKIYKRRDDLQWTHAVDNVILKEIEYPYDAEKYGQVYQCELKDGFFVLTGTYSVRFYFEEDSYNYEKKAFVTFILVDRDENTNSIAFMTDEDVGKNKTSELTMKFIRNMNKKYPLVRNNLVYDIYKSANFIANDLKGMYGDIINYLEKDLKRDE
ncbi:hypothetical protein [Bacillus altitudinis]|uniref:hypothetical protein n=1 Tax=Bacillus altitudinis TaxID=293387 RepID=UPI002DB667A9|nr:hypothetical protein [Bacillus altitudinis]MEC0969374.1 hypothetical protein [Bacillus altitudinis]MEC1001940.1 hypothetical protein [Bacillus altitudinis]